MYIVKTQQQTNTCGKLQPAQNKHSFCFVCFNLVQFSFHKRYERCSLLRMHIHLCSVNNLSIEIKPLANYWKLQEIEDMKRKKSSWKNQRHILFKSCSRLGFDHETMEAVN